MVTSWWALAFAVILAVMSVDAWRRVIRSWHTRSLPTAPMALVDLFGPAAGRRLMRASWLNAVCWSGLTVMLLGGAWLPSEGRDAPTSSAALVITLVGLGIFFLGLFTQLSIAIFGWPLSLLPRDTSADAGGEGGGRTGWEDAGHGSRNAQADATGSVNSADGRTEISVRRDKDDSFAQLRRYDVYVDGERVGRIRRGEECSAQISPGAHTVQVKISWCSSPVFPVDVTPGERRNLSCRAVPGAEADPVGGIRRRSDVLVLR
ncbi:hypothetical protein [Streptomyces sp. NBC_00102]|uniref:hypothetical protein n=1 Tax=Streptomyces sp. NBC_00102 TaxID=2975652 RepID=UPI0022530F6A|nr:hypothetical protein [Streptomyces sp. NBC_00102]MCX5402041.1 hypothetical protein [Streptomyces sp. NBC_00102]